MNAREKKSPTNEPHLTIGGLSRATGIPVATLRTWERRYGFPNPMRKPSSHRLYALPIVARLRRISHALNLGHRAAEVVMLDPLELERLIAVATGSLPAEAAAREDVIVAPSGAASSAAKSKTAAPRPFGAELADANTFDRARLQARFHERYVALGPLRFVTEYAGPLMVAVGEAWRERRIEVRHEHFASGRLADFLRAARQPFDDLARGPIVVATTLPGEEHEVGLLMACLVFSVEGWRVLYLGPSTPTAEIASLVRDAPIAAVALSFARASDAAARRLASLRRALPPRVALYAGGTGAPTRVRGVRRIADLNGLEHDLREARVRSTA